jgi:hypothetical protein
LERRQVRFAGLNKGPAAAGRREANPGRGIAGFFRLPEARAFNVASVAERLRSCCAGEGGGVAGISAHSSRCEGGGGGLGAFAGA